MLANEQIKITMLRILSTLFKKSHLWKSNFVTHIVSKVNNLIPKPTHVTINHRQIFIHPQHDTPSMSLYYHASYEKTETSILAKIISKGDTVIDVGSHIGYYTLFFSDLVGNPGKVYSFEPNPQSFSLLNQNVAANKLTNVQTEMTMVADTTRPTNFYISHDNQADSKSFSFNSKDKLITSVSTTIDHYFKSKNKQVDLVKIDVQGAEYKVLTGMSNLITCNKQLIIFLEYWPYGLQRVGNTPSQLLEFLHQHKFRVYDYYDLNPHHPPKPASLAILQRRYSNQNIFDVTNLICLRNPQRLTPALSPKPV